MTTEKFLLRIICIILILIVLLIDYHQYEQIKKCQKSIINIQELIYINWRIKQYEKLKLPPPLEFDHLSRPEFDLPVSNPHEQICSLTI